MLRRTPFRRKPPKHEPTATEREPKPLAKAASLHVGTYAGTTAAGVPKDALVRHEGYRRLVASLPCKLCGIHGFSQCAHSNLGKGMGTKADDRESFPLCAAHPVLGGLVPGCHASLDQGAMFTKSERRALEPAWAADTRRTIFAMGLWPSDLPMLEIECQSRRN
jgi:hypothetical protein